MVGIIGAVRRLGCYATAAFVQGAYGLLYFIRRNFIQGACGFFAAGCSQHQSYKGCGVYE